MIDQALSRLVKDGKLRQIGRGFYDIPRTNPMLGAPAAPDDGPSRNIDLDGRTLRLRHAGTKLMALKDKPAGDIVRALHRLGRDMAGDDAIVRKLRGNLPPKVKDDLAKARPTMTAWTADIAGRIAA